MAKTASKRPAAPAAKYGLTPQVPADEVVYFNDVEQRSADWHALRAGIPTASRFSDVLAGGEGKSRENYLHQLVGERISGRVEETYQSSAMRRGIEMEPEAREWYERSELVDVEQIGFVKRTITTPLGYKFEVGCSPDSRTGPRKGIEIKSETPTILIPRIKRGAAGFPTEHKAQCQGVLMVCDWDELDLIVFWPKMAIKFTIVREEAYIAMLRDQLERFCWERDKLIEDIKKRIK